MAKLDVEKTLMAGLPVTFPLTGMSMNPLFMGGRDYITAEPVPEGYKFKRLDVVLYRREGSVLVLHRIYKVKPEGLYLVGDHQKEIEGPLPYKQVRGIMTSAIRKGKTLTLNEKWYKLYSWGWMLIRPFRLPILNLYVKIKLKVKK